MVRLNRRLGGWEHELDLRRSIGVLFLMLKLQILRSMRRNTCSSPFELGSRIVIGFVSYAEGNVLDLLLSIFVLDELEVELLGRHQDVALLLRFDFEVLFH